MARAPLVDIQNTRQQKVVSAGLLAALPTGQMNVNSLVALTPGLTGGADVGGSQGVYSSSNVGNTFRGKTGTNKTTYDGMRTHNIQGDGSTGYIINAASVEETTIETGGNSADSLASGIAINLVPKEGSNVFKGSFFGLITNDSLQSDNLDDVLRARGLTTVNGVNYLHDFNGTLGGPIKQDRLWFFTAHRWTANKIRIAERFWNKTQGTPFYTPDLDRPFVSAEEVRMNTGRLTWQAS